MLRFVGDGDQKRFTKNPRHFSMQNSQAKTKKIFTKCFFGESRQSEVFWTEAFVTLVEGQPRSKGTNRRREFGGQASTFKLLQHNLRQRTFACVSSQRKFLRVRRGCQASQRKGPDLRGRAADLRGSLGNFRGSLGNFRGSSGLLLSSTVREVPGKWLPGKWPKNFRGEVRGVSRSSGEPDSLPTTRQICLQNLRQPTFACISSSTGYHMENRDVRARMQNLV